MMNLDMWFIFKELMESLRFTMNIQSSWDKSITDNIYMDNPEFASTNNLIRKMKMDF